MEACMTPRCGRQARTGEPFCHECRRILTDEDRYALRMAYKAPAYSASAWVGESGINLIWVHEGNASQSVKGADKAAQFMHWLEWNLVAAAIGKRIQRVKLKRSARERLASRR